MSEAMPGFRIPACIIATRKAVQAAAKAAPPKPTLTMDTTMAAQPPPFALAGVIGNFEGYPAGMTNTKKLDAIGKYLQALDTCPHEPVVTFQECVYSFSPEAEEEERKRAARRQEKKEVSSFVLYLINIFL